LKKQSTSILIIFVILLYILTPNLCFAATTQLKEENKLDSIIKIINQIKNRIFHSGHKVISLKDRLKTLETKKSHINKTLLTIKRKEQNIQKKLHILTTKNKYYISKLHIEKTKLKKELYAIYLLNHYSYTKIILNNNMNQIPRLIIYNKYLANYRLTILSKLTKILHTLERNKKLKKNELYELNKYKLEKSNTLSELNHIKAKRERLLYKIKKKMRHDKTKLEILINNKKHLETIIKKLKLEHISEAFSKPFNKLKKKLPFPIKSKLLTSHFGEKILHSQLTQTGMIIKATTGSPIRAIANGKVVFSQWLNGYGLLIIINHGHGYMSLYGRCELLYKKVGDIVTKGEKIGLVGNTGGFNYSSLYFGIRHNGKAINPTKWCSF